MKKFKIHYLLSLTLILALLSGMTFHAFAFSSSKGMEGDITQEDVIWVIDHQVENPPQNAGQVYLYPDGKGGYISVEEEIDVCVSQEQVAEEAATEVILTPVQIDEATYIYVDEEGTMVLTLTMENANNAIAPLDLKKYGFKWRLEAGTYTHGSTDHDASTEISIHVGMINEYQTVTYVGFYSATANSYYWIEPPLTTNFTNYTFRVISSHPINFAIKNSGTRANVYTGDYYIT